MSKTAILEIDGKRYEFPVVEGSNEQAIDIKKLRDLTGIITLIQVKKIQVLVPVKLPS
jgi:citrate synthase